MHTVATLLDTPAALVALRRSLPRGYGRVRGCRSPDGLAKLVASTLVDVVVVGAATLRRGALRAFRARFPAVPLVVYGAVRPDDAPFLAALAGDRSVRMVLVEGVDDPMAGELAARNGYLAGRRARLADLPRALRLTERLQREAFRLLLESLGPPPTTDALAATLGVSREHLSRQFAAGGAPNLKRVTGLLSVLLVRDLLANPGYTPAVVAELTGFGRPSHLRETVRRVVGLSLDELQAAEGPDPVRRFMGARSRSRS